MSVYLDQESRVKIYCRHFPKVFTWAKGSKMRSEDGKTYIDFFSGAGSLNYGHNNDFIKERLIRYMMEDGITQGLDMHTAAKREFIEKFTKYILEAEGYRYKLQFCGPTGANAVEAALKLARKAKGRHGIFAFMGSFHGVSLGSLSVTSKRFHRKAAEGHLSGTTFIPFPDGSDASFDSLGYMERLLADEYSGVEKPAAVIVETVQAEGGVYVASSEWLQQLSDWCRKHDVLMICDDIQVGCGRTGRFFSFTRAGIEPDIVVLSKSISGYGLPMSMLLIKPELDVWEPGEHNGTFRGNQLAFVGGAAALDYRLMYDLEREVYAKEAFIRNYMNNEILSRFDRISVRGIGVIWGLDFSAFPAGTAESIANRCFSAGLIVENSGRNNSVLKIMPALTIEWELLEQGLSIIKQELYNLSPLKAI